MFLVPLEAERFNYGAFDMSELPLDCVPDPGLPAEDDEDEDGPEQVDAVGDVPDVAGASYRPGQYLRQPSHAH